ncbi:hypothetical protein RFI_10342 [Reticulomyxa filosa]|uniref:Uncharacterized protein n=1 Tax=Reticulomyxa filosa TaxID=46433 RepID=X6NKE5_RETFI|nr:hypothetical protein RFI_10342 [Reticulomyxa filosa]|eukprot:ETO26790.1 hypothetical protein RFI_10342 [Reticulomyxa filosa]
MDSYKRDTKHQTKTAKQGTVVSIGQKYLATDVLRRKRMEEHYSWWPCCKYLAWVFTLTWTLVCAVVTFVVRFNILRHALNSYQSAAESQCPNYLDIGDATITAYNATANHYVATMSTSTSNEQHGFGGEPAVDRWLLSIFVGFFLSLFVWQPLFMLVFQIIRILRFDPERVTESYYFANTKLLLTQTEREILIESGTVISSDDNADKESDHEDDHYQFNVEDNE